MLLPSGGVGSCDDEDWVVEEGEARKVEVLDRVELG